MPAFFWTALFFKIISRLVIVEGGYVVKPASAKASFPFLRLRTARMLRGSIVRLLLPTALNVGLPCGPGTRRTRLLKNTAGPIPAELYISLL
jgi:hypothetical protein